MRACDPTLWQGRLDAAEGPLGRRWHQAMRPVDAATSAGSTVLIGFACDSGVARNHGRPGAAEGPRALRLALRNLPLHDCEALADAGDVVCEGDALEAAQEDLAQQVATQLGAGRFPLVLGGGHEVAVGSFSGLARHLAAGEAAPRVGIVNFDAHFDLRRDDRATSGTPFRQIAEDCAARGWPFRYACLGVSRYANTKALFARAQALDVLWREDAQCAASGTEAALAGFLAGLDHVYLTVCLDVLPAAVVPGVSAPAPRGVELAVLEPLIDAVCASGKVRVADLAELNPRLDLDGRSAAVAARLAARIVDGVARAAR